LFSMNSIKKSLLYGTYTGGKVSRTRFSPLAETEVSRVSRVQQRARPRSSSLLRRTVQVLRSYFRPERRTLSQCTQ